MQRQAAQSVEALTERLRFSHPPDDATVVVSTLYAGTVLEEYHGKSVKFSERGAQMVLSQAYMVYGILDRQLRTSNNFWGSVAQGTNINFYPQTLPSVNFDRAVAALALVNFGCMRSAVEDYDPYMSALMKGACGRPLDSNERFAAEHGCLAVYSILNAYIRPHYLQ